MLSVCYVRVWCGTFNMLEYIIHIYTYIISISYLCMHISPAIKFSTLYRSLSNNDTNAAVRYNTKYLCFFLSFGSKRICNNEIYVCGGFNNDNWKTITIQ